MLPIHRRSIGVIALALCLFGLVGCNAMRVFFPSSHHDEIAPEIPDGMARPAVLVFSKTNGFRHHEAIDAGLPFFEATAHKRGWGYFATENGAVHNAEQLARFDVVIWFQSSGNVLDDTQRSALREWIESGGSFFGIHGTGGDPEYDWEWQPQMLVGAQFIGHPMNPQFQEATLRIEERLHPVVKHLDANWTRTDEWYSFEESPRAKGAQILATLDESTYSPRMNMFLMDRDLSMGEDHPAIWIRCIGRGRSLYSALGHLADAYAEPLHQTFLEESIAWLIRVRSEACESPR
jgi:type 1 glutamine amidotransferase